MRSKEGSFLGKLEEESFLEKLEGGYSHPQIAKLTLHAKIHENIMGNFLEKQEVASLGSKEGSFLEKLEGGYSHPSYIFKLTSMPK